MTQPQQQQIQIPAEFAQMLGMKELELGMLRSQLKQAMERIAFLENQALEMHGQLAAEETLLDREPEDLPNRAERRRLEKVATNGAS